MSEFVTTSWSQVLAARSGTSTESRDALQELCQAYWYPIYALVRRQGYDPDAARDLTQGYFTQLLEKDYLQDFDPELGRFRTFLKTSVKHFLSKEREKANASKRGGKVTVVTLDAGDAETRYGLERVGHASPEEVFERRWAFLEERSPYPGLASFTEVRAQTSPRAATERPRAKSKAVTRPRDRRTLPAKSKVIS